MGSLRAGVGARLAGAAYRARYGRVGAGRTGETGLKAVSISLYGGNESSWIAINRTSLCGRPWHLNREVWRADQGIAHPFDAETISEITIRRRISLRPKHIEW